MAKLPVGQAPDGSGDQTGPPLAWSWRPGGQEGWARGHCLWPTSGACRTNGDLSRRRDGKWTERQGWAGANGEAQKTLPIWVLLSHWTKSAGVLVLRSVPALLPPCWEKARIPLSFQRSERGGIAVPVTAFHLATHSFIHWSWHRGGHCPPEATSPYMPPYPSSQRSSFLLILFTIHPNPIGLSIVS